MKRITFAADGATVLNVERIDDATPPLPEGIAAIAVADAVWVGLGLRWNGDPDEPAFAPAA